MPQTKPTLAVDFDGVLHSYTSGWKGAANIPDPPVEGALDFLRRAVAEFHVVIFSSRSGEQGGVTAMINALSRWGLEWDTLSQIEFPTSKPAAFLTIDDRCYLFTGKFPTVEALRSFKTWQQTG